jgi:hypothetical protein
MKKNENINFESWNRRLESGDRSDPLLNLADRLQKLFPTPDDPSPTFQKVLRARLLDQFTSTPRRRFTIPRRRLAWGLMLLAAISLIFVGLQLLPGGVPDISAAEVFEKAGLRLAQRLGDNDVIYDRIILDWKKGGFQREDVVAELWRTADGSNLRYQMVDGNELLYFEQHDAENLWRSSYIRPVYGDGFDFVYQAAYVPGHTYIEMDDKQLVAQLLFRDLSNFWLYIDQMAGSDNADCADLFCTLSSLGEGWECSGNRCTLNLGPIFEDSDFILTAEVTGQSTLRDGSQVYEVRTYLPEVGDRWYTILKFDTTTYDLLEIEDYSRNKLQYRIRLAERKIMTMSDLPAGFFQTIPEGVEVRTWEGDIPLGHQEDDRVWIISAEPSNGASLSGVVTVHLEIGYRLTSLEVAEIKLGLFWAGHDSGSSIQYEKMPVTGGEGAVQISFTVDADQLGEGMWVVQPGFADTMGIAPNVVWGGAGTTQGIYLEYCVRCAAEP